MPSSQNRPGNYNLLRQFPKTALTFASRRYHYFNLPGFIYVERRAVQKESIKFLIPTAYTEKLIPIHEKKQMDPGRAEIVTAIFKGGRDLHRGNAIGRRLT